ncbi:MAG: DUF1874 domain-containing protein [Deltaproteobacteria bacterium]|nr:DUF1874 domain-containing protein [Deltaproteobacteria bacterium]
MMTIYLFNSLITPVNFDKETKAEFSVRKISPEEAKRKIEKGYVCVVGHEPTVRAMESVIGMPLTCERRSVFMEPGDEGVHLFLKQRLPEGITISREKMEEIGYWLVHSRRER